MGRSGGAEFPGSVQPGRSPGAVGMTLEVFPGCFPWDVDVSQESFFFSSLSKSSTALNSFYFPPRPHITLPLAKQPREDPKFTFFQESTKINNFLCSSCRDPGQGVGRIQGWELLPFPPAWAGVWDDEVFTLQQSWGRSQIPLPQLGCSEGTLKAGDGK